MPITLLDILGTPPPSTRNLKTKTKAQEQSIPTNVKRQKLTKQNEPIIANEVRLQAEASQTEQKTPQTQPEQKTPQTQPEQKTPQTQPEQEKVRLNEPTTIPAEKDTQEKPLSDNDFIASILDQVTSGMKSRNSFTPTPPTVSPIVPPIVPPKQIKNNTETQRFSPYEGDMKQRTKKKNRNKTMKEKRQHLQKKASTPSIAYLDTPSQIKETDFDDEMDGYFAASQAKQTSVKQTPVNHAQAKQTQAKQTHVPVMNRVPITKRTEGNNQKMTIEDVAGQILGTTVKKKSIWKNRNNKFEPKKPFVPLIRCTFFDQGYCKDGDKCTFKHDTSNDPPVCPLWKKGKCIHGDLCRFKHEGPRDIKICQFYKSNSCSKGNDCPFSHELSAEPCRFFHLQKTCEQESCPYSHEELTTETLGMLRKLTGPCRFWQFKGFCVTGDACLFSHDDVSEEERKKLESTITPCIYYHVKGGCRSGDECFYLHDEATAEQVEQFKKSIAAKPTKN
ncbi:hypothetical protein G6F56_004754 [Rhizopus delemar]|nr:hypothetical protein G6F56_004754 [Rhizopus delemar]